MSPSARHLAPWAARCPGKDASAGKRRSGETRKGSKRLRAALCEAAHAAAANRGSYLQAHCHRIRVRLGPARAVAAVGQSILVACWHMLTPGELYQDSGADYYLRRDLEGLTRRLVAQVERLGHQVTLHEAPQPAGTGTSLQPRPSPQWRPNSGHRLTTFQPAAACSTLRAMTV
jgi:hypothetical protein